tara:strand:- start:362 stop:565 length:204 start_codon:yes stop_codon:yes gene_type:complete
VDLLVVEDMIFREQLKTVMLAHNQVVMGVMEPVTVAVAVAELVIALDLMQEHLGAVEQVVTDIHQQF